MIEFDCPECETTLAVGNEKAGERVRCVECCEQVRVPRESRKKRRAAQAVPRDRLSTEESILYGAVFLISPGINVVLSSILHYVWKESLPTKAYQINQLGWIIFAMQMLPIGCLCCVGAFMGRDPLKRRF